MSSITEHGEHRAAAPKGVNALWDRQLPHYPNTGPRLLYLGITVAATIALYYELYVQGAVSNTIIADFHFSFQLFVTIVAISNVCGALASLAAGLADRWGRANLVVVGLLLTGLLVLFAIPNATSKLEFGVYSALVGIVEGMALVATPALIRDFSPQVGRGTAMAFWTMGPVLGSLVVTEVSSHTLSSHSDWQYQFRICGIVGLIVWFIALLGLRELSPRLRDQLMVSMRDRELIEARAAGIDPEQATKGHWRQMLKLDVAGSALAISLFLMAYYVFVAFLVVYFATVFGYSAGKANSLANWYWITAAIAIAVVGLASDRVLVRKPFMIAGALISLVGLGLFAAAATDPSTGYYTLAFDFVLIAVGVGMAYVAWMAGFTETVEAHNPAATATGLAIYGWTVRTVVFLAFILLPVVVPATTTLADKGARVSSIVATYPKQVQVLNTVDPATLTALNANPNDTAAQAKALSELSGLSVTDVAKVTTLGTKYIKELATATAVDPATLTTVSTNPTNQSAAARAVGEIASKFSISPPQATARLVALGQVPQADLLFLKTNGTKVQAAGASLQAVSKIPTADLAYLSDNGAKVAKAQKDNPGQWQTWWWVCFIAQCLFIPFVFLMAGHWNPRKAKAAERAHEQMVMRELAMLEQQRGAAV
ncbi:MAG: MFS transporter [Jatrophihabitans sp.]